MKKNKQLRELYSQWYKKTLLPFLKNKNTTIYSLPFVSGMLAEHKQTIMIIGQEARIYDHFTEYSNPQKLISDRQNWTLGYLSRQLYKNDDYKNYYNEYIKYNRSPFWNFFRRFKENYNIVWSNLDKVHTFTKGDVKALNIEDEVALNQRNLNGKSILEREIEIIQPDVVIFITGPNYQQSMETALGLDKGILQNFAQKMKITQNELPITSIKECGNQLFDASNKVFWTYHPNYLNYKKKLSSCIEHINNSLSK